MLRRTRLIAATCLALGTAGAGTAQASSLDSFLFAPTYSDRYVPETRNTKYDCRIVSKKYGAANVWKGFAGGRKFLGDGRMIPVSRVGCFQTEKECKGFLTLMSGYIDIMSSRSCQKGD